MGCISSRNVNEYILDYHIRVAYLLGTAVNELIMINNIHNNVGSIEFYPIVLQRDVDKIIKMGGKIPRTITNITSDASLYGWLYYNGKVSHIPQIYLTALDDQREIMRKFDDEK